MPKLLHNSSNMQLNSTLVKIHYGYLVDNDLIWLGDPEAQAELIAHLQDEHYAQYMAQLSMRENEDEPVPAPQIPLSDREIKIEPPSMWTRPQIRLV